MSDEMSREEALAKIKIPGIGLIITGALGAVNSLMSAVQFMAIDDVTDQVVEQQQDEQAAEMTEKIMEVYKTVGWPVIILGLAGAVFVLLGGLNMLKGQKKGMCMGACIVSFIPFLSPCCPLGLVFGIWGLVALGKAEAAFSSAAQ